MKERHIKDKEHIHCKKCKESSDTLIDNVEDQDYSYGPFGYCLGIKQKN